MDRRTFLWVAPLAALALTACSRSGSGSGSAELKKLTVDEVATRLAANDGKTFVYDNNPRDRYAKGHLPGAHWVESGDVTADVLPKEKDATLIFYCASEL